jgi:hypothetical protein
VSKSYQRCPYCNIRATNRKWLKLDDDYIEFHPCHHAFPKEQVVVLDGIVDRIYERTAELERHSTESQPFIEHEVSDLENRLRAVKWRVAAKRRA